MRELQNEKTLDLENKQELLNTSKELREFVPEVKTIEEYDKMISDKMVKQYPELFKENVDVNQKDEKEFLIQYLVDDYEKQIADLE